MDGRTYIRKISPFYRTSSPIGAAAQKVVTDQWTDQQTDQRTYKTSYRDAWTHLKIPAEIRSFPCRHQ